MSSRPMKRLSTQNFITSKKKITKQHFHYKEKNESNRFLDKLKSYQEQIYFSTGSSMK